MDYQNKSKEELIADLLNLEQEVIRLKDLMDNPFQKDNLAQSDLPGSESCRRFADEEAMDVIGEGDLLTNFKNTKFALHESELKYHNLIENINDVIYEVDNHGIIKYVSSSVEKIIGYSAEELLGKNISDFVGDNSKLIYERLDILGTNRESKSEYKILTKDREPRWIRLASTALIKNGNPEGATGTLIDITDKKLVELKLQESESLYRSVLNASPDTISITDLQGKILFTSLQGLKMFRFNNPEDFYSHSLLDFVVPDERQRAADNIAEMFTNKQERVREFTGLRLDGTTFNLETKGDFIRDDEGNPVRMVFISRDISERKLAQEALKKSEEKYRMLVETINDVFYEIDKEAIIKYVSPAVERIFGYKAEEMTGRIAFEFMHPDDIQWVKENFFRTGTNADPHLEYRYLSKSGEVRWVRSSATRKYENGQVVGGTGTLYDITERKIAEEALKESEERFSKTFSMAPYSISLTNVEDGHIINSNETFLNYFGYSREEIINDPSLNLKLWRNPDDRDSVIKELFDSQSISGREYDFVNKEGVVLNSFFSARVIYLQNKPYILSSFNDISERKIAQIKIEKLNRLYQVISHINKAIIHYRVKEQLIDEVCRIAVKYGKFQLAWIGLVDEQTKLVQPMVADGFEQGFLTVFKPISISDDAENRGPIGTAIKSGNHFVFGDFMTDPRVGIWKEEALKRGYRSSITLPLTQFGKIAGTFTLYSSIPDFFIPEEISLLDEVVNEISFAFEAIDTENERIQTENQLRKLSGAVEQSPVSIVITDLDGNIEYANPKTIETTGYSLEELVGVNPRVLKSGETKDQEYETLWGNISSGKEWKGTFHNKRKNGELYWESSTINPIIDRNGSITHYLGIKEDITGRVLIQEALMKSEERYRQIALQSQTVFWEVDEKVLFTYVDQLSETVWGYKPGELVGKMYFYELHPSEGLEEFKQQALQTLTRKESLFNFENRIITKDGRIIWVSTNEIPILDEQNNLLGYRGADYDITSRKQAEDELRKFRTIADQANYGTAIASLDGSVIYLNEAFSRMHGYEAHELIGKNLTNFHNEEQLPKVAELIQTLNTTGSFSALEVWHARKDGSVFPTLMNASIIRDKNNIPQFFSATVIDNSELKQKEEALQRSEETLNNAQELAKMGNWEHNFLTGKLTGSRNYYRLLGLMPNEKKEELFNYFISLVHPEDLEIFTKINQRQFVENDLQVVEFRIVLPGGKVKWIHHNILPLFENGRFIGLRGVTIDVTAQRESEQKIEVQNERLSAIVKAIPDLIIVCDRLGTYLEYYAGSQGKLLEDETQIIGSNIRQTFDEESANMHLEKIGECLLTGTLITYEYSAQFGNSPHFFEARLAPAGENKVLAFIRDITERRRNDEAIKKLSLAVEQSPVSIVITDLSGNIEYVNSSFEKTTQFNYDEIIGQNVRILQSGKTDRTIYENLWHTIEAGNEWKGEWINKKKNGELFWENISISPIHNETGAITSYLAVKQDVTSKKETEKKIRDLNSNLELKIEIRTSELATANLKLVSEIEERIRIGEALVKSEKSYRSVVENVTEVIFQTDAAGLWLFLNKSWEEVTGFSIAESLGQLFLNYVHPDDRQRNMELFEPLINRKKDYCRHEIRYLTKDGGFRWVEVFARLGINEQDEIIGTYGTLNDITVRKEAENHLEQLSFRLSLAVQAGGVGVWDFDIINNNLMWDDQMVELYGIKRDCFSGAYQAWQQWLHPNDQVRVDHEIQMAIGGEKEFNSEFRVIWPDGTIHYIRAMAIVQRNELGKAVQMIGTNWDITANKVAEGELKSKMALLDAQKNATPDGILVIDETKEHFIVINKRFIEIFELPADIADNGNASELLSHIVGLVKNPEIFLETTSELYDNPLTSQNDEIELKSGMIFDRYSAPVLGPDGHFYGRIWSYRDITERKKTEEEIIKTRNEAETANLAKSEFLSRMSHELRTPMNSILGFAQLMVIGGELNAQQNKGLDHILNSGKHLLNLINEVLEISRIEAGHLAISLEPVLIGNIIIEILDSIQPLALDMDIKFNLLESSENQLFVLSDYRRLKQVLLNLMTNSIKYNRNGGSVIIKTESYPGFEAESPYLRVTVRDTGLGISSEDISRLFKPFERIGAEKTKTEGTGLGLSVAKKLMEAMGGRIGVDSVPGTGSSFWIELPTVENQLNLGQETIIKGDGDSEQNLYSGTILYIEDNPSNVELVEQILFSYRPNIRLVSDISGLQAVPIALKLEPGLILLDLNLPDIHGDEVIRLLQNQEKTKKIPVVIISADAMAPQLQKSLKAGARNYLTKPLDVVNFLYEVDKWIGINQKL